MSSVSCPFEPYVAQSIVHVSQSIVEFVLSNVDVVLCIVVAVQSIAEYC